MKLLALIIVTIFSFSAFSNWCNKSYRYENFWISSAASFGEKVQKNKYLDEMCWQLGAAYGKDIRASYSRNLKACETAFNSGKEDGLRGETQFNDFPTECYDLGLRYGISLLTSNARLGKNVNSNNVCAINYKKGLEHGKHDIVAQPSSLPLESTCYMAGFQDGMLFRDLL